MNIQNKFLQQSGEPDLITVLKGVINKVGTELNCVRVGIIQSFNKDDLTVEVLIANKKTLGINQDGTQKTRDYALVRAKLCYCCPFITYPITKGEECILLFSDREIESWFISGEVQPEAYQRMHDLTDCIAIVGLRSLAKMIQILNETFHLFYYGTDLQLGVGDIISNAPSYTINANSQININAPVVNVNGNLNVSSGYSGTVPCGSAVLNITNGIVTGVT